MGSKSERRAARELAALPRDTARPACSHVAEAVDAHRADTIGVHDVNEVIHHRHRAARELWKFCWAGGGGGAHIEIVARIIEEPVGDEDPVDWWEHGAPPERGDRRTR